MAANQKHDAEMWTGEMDSAREPEPSGNVMCDGNGECFRLDCQLVGMRARRDRLLAALKAIVDDAVGERRDPLWIVKRDLITDAIRLIAKEEGK